jgi:sulfite oxidase
MMMQGTREPWNGVRVDEVTGAHVAAAGELSEREERWQERLQAAEERDRLADQRDATADRRDRLADARDDLANGRDRRSIERDVDVDVVLRRAIDRDVAADRRDIAARAGTRPRSGATGRPAG